MFIIDIIVCYFCKKYSVNDDKSCKKLKKCFELSISFAFHFRALAVNCNAPIDTKNGSTSKDWRKGKPVRVVRNCKLAKHSEYAPEEGNRYDGIYKVCIVSHDCSTWD